MIKIAPMTIDAIGAAFLIAMPLSVGDPHITPPTSVAGDACLEMRVPAGAGGCEPDGDVALPR
jgi:hypothetical protein